MFDTITVGISIHALHEESDAGTRRVRPRHAISIHALHEESDQKRVTRDSGLRDFNPRSP